MNMFPYFSVKRDMANSSVESYVQLFQITVYIPTFVLGLLFNMMALWFIFCKIRKLTESTIYLVSLITLDTLLLFTLPFKIISFGSQGEWNLGSAFCSFLESLESYVQLFQITVYIPTFVLGLLFNMMALWFIFCKIRKLTESTIYLVSLITLDTLLLFSLPFKIISFGSQGEWNLGSAFCSFLESLYFVNMYGSILISVCICVDRYIAIRHPFLAVSLRSTKKAAMVCSIVCLGVWAGTSFTYQFHDSTHTTCFHGFSNKIWENPGVLLTLETVFLGSVTAMIFCTAQIIICLKRSRKPDDPLTDTSKSVKIVVGNLTTFVVCFTPFHVAFLLYYLVKTDVITSNHQPIIRSFVQISLCWANLNCCLDAICYYFVLKEFLKSPLQESEITTNSS